MTAVAQKARNASLRLNWLVERVCVALLVVLILDVWLGVLVRYAIPLPITFTEEAARYLMIWTALLAVSSGIAHREHIGVLVLFERFPARLHKYLAVGFDIVGLVFFGFLLIYGLGFVERGFDRITMIYAIPKAYPFAAVPVAAAVCCAQLILVAIHDFFSTDAVTAAGRLEA